MIDAKEKSWILKVTVVALMLANVPSILGFLTTPAGTVYTGIDSTAPGDVNVYLSYLEQAYQGHFLFRDLFTAEPQTPRIFNPFWLVLGLLGSVLKLSTVATYFLSRIVLGAMLLGTIYFLASKVFTDVLQRRIGFVLAVFGAGVGAWVAPIVSAFFTGTNLEKVWPMDLWVSEGYTFLSLHHSPHFLGATILILLSVWWLMQVVETGRLKPTLCAGISMLALYSFHPFHVLSLGMVTIGFLVVTFIRDRTRVLNVAWRLVVSWIVASPALLYHAWLILKDPLAAGRAQQNILPTSSLPVTLMSYGFLAVGAAIGAVLLWRGRSLRTQLLVAWAASHALAIYLPIFFNRRVTQGLNIVLAFLAAAAIAYVWTRFQRNRTNVFTNPITLSVIGFILFGMSTLWVTAQDLSFLLGSKGRAFPYYFYLDRDYHNALQWLRTNGNDDTVVLSGLFTGNFVPGRSGRRVVVGHNVETVDFERKRDDALRFFGDQATDEWRVSFLKAHRATLVIVGPWEQLHGSFDGSSASYLTPAYESGSVRIYRVVLPASS